MSVYRRVRFPLSVATRCRNFSLEGNVTFRRPQHEDSQRWYRCRYSGLHETPHISGWSFSAVTFNQIRTDRNDDS